MINKKDKVIALDGPSGSGKSTLAKLLALTLQVKYIDSGAMYRTLAYVLSSMPIDFSKSSLNQEELNQITKKISQHTFEYMPTSDILIQVDGQDLSQIIRQNEVSLKASMTSKFEIVRDFVNDWQRRVVKDHFAVVDGRDIGTVLFPNAILKYYVTASVDVRSQRRYLELMKKGNFKGSIDSIKKEIAERDFQDTSREIAPLKQADDAILIDTSNLRIDEVVKRIVTDCKTKGILNE
jgi:cytidylate kinase